MGQQKEVRYDYRTVDEWVKRARDGQMAVADFQRSFVWPVKKAERYVSAIFRGRPVGIYLILDSAASPQFSPRRFSNMTTPLGGVEELVLDGQQRLTSLLHALYGGAGSRFFIEVEDLAAEILEPKRVVAYGNSSPDAKRLEEPLEAYRSRHIPLDALRRPVEGSGKTGPLTQWCSDVGPKAAGYSNYAEMADFQERILRFAEKCFFQRRLYACWLPADTTRAEATEIFVETNTSSVRIKKFDEHAAKVRGEEDQDFRTMIARARRDSEVLRYFFPGTEEKAIPQIGTWLLKLGCLHAGFPPKEGYYEEAARHLFESASNDEPIPPNLKSALEDVDWVLKRVSDLGSPTQSTLPSWPPVHVLAAIRARYLRIEAPEEANAARRLIDAYYWRSLFTNRHERQANDNLHKDFKELVEVFKEEKAGAGDMRIFSDRHHPLYNVSALATSTGWIGKSRLGKALVSAVLASGPTPVDWITGEALRATHLRELERGRNLHRHHVFPKDVLLTAEISLAEIDNGLNGVLLDRRSNRRFWKFAPDEYVVRVTESKGIEEAEIRQRIAGHRVPFNEMTHAKGAIRDRYRRFLQARAKLLAKHIKQLAGRPT